MSSLDWHTRSPRRPWLRPNDLAAWTRPGVETALTVLSALWRQIAKLEIDDELVRAAGGLARRFALRGYDAVHCAAAHGLKDDQLIAVSGDRRLLGAWSALGLLTADTGG